MAAARVSTAADHSDGGSLVVTQNWRETEFMANSHVEEWFRLRKRWASWNHEPITAVRWFAGRSWEELTIVANSSGATIISLQSHPLWIAAQRQARERSEAMNRHPSSRPRERSAASRRIAAPHIRDFKILTSNDTPA